MIVPDYVPPSALMVPYYPSDLLPLFEDLASEASRHIGVILLAQLPAAAQAFVELQPDPERFSIVAAEHDSPWIRDRSPIAIRAREGVRWVLPRLPETDRKRDDELFDLLVAREREPSPIRVAGGNLVAGPRGIAVSSAAVLVENGCSAEQLKRHAAHLGIRRWILFPPFTDETSGHADIHVRFLRQNLVAVAWNPDNRADQHVSRGLESMLRRTLPRARILRLPVRAEGERYASPLNWVQLGRRLLVPVFTLTPAEDRRLLCRDLEAEGFRVTFIESSSALDLGGSLHCLTASVFV
jgi:agmatine/peptidylarginine deiminase